MKTALTSLFVTAALVAGCAAQTDSVGSDDVGTQSDDISATSRTYVAVRRDMRKCAYPMCGGYFVHDVNRVTLNEKYVTALDFTTTSLDQASIDDALGAAPEELLLRGKLGPIASNGTRTFIVSDAWLGMPGRPPAAGATFYSSAVHPIECFTTPCNQNVSTKLNYTTTKSFTGIDVVSAPPSFGDQAWLAAQALEHGGLIAGTFVQGAHDPGGYERILDASQVYVKLPYAVTCSPGPEVDCGVGMVRTFTRDEDRCLQFAGCVTPGVCPLFLPACEDGYTLESWATGTSACNAYACDPTFVTE